MAGETGMTKVQISKEILQDELSLLRQCIEDMESSDQVLEFYQEKIEQRLESLEAMGALGSDVEDQQASYSSPRDSLEDVVARASAIALRAVPNFST